MLTIDAHHHFWDRTRREFHYDWLDTPAHRPIAQSHLPADLKPLMQAENVDYCICVQTQHQLRENDWALSLAEDHPWVAGVVGWVDLQSEACAEQLAQYQSHPQWVGVRHVIQDEPDPEFLLRPSVLRGLGVLESVDQPFDLLLYMRHLHLVPQLAIALPSLPIVLDHLGKPTIREATFDDWLPLIRDIAAHKNIYCKLSGLVTESHWHAWNPEDLRRYLETAIELFGPERCMFGTDWPVCLLGGTYSQVIGLVRDTIASLTTDEQERIMSGTAREFYRLHLRS